MSTTDISSLTYAELGQLKADVAERMKEMRETGITQLRATIVEQANLLGISPDDLLPKKKRKARKRNDDGDGPADD